MSEIVDFIAVQLAANHSSANTRCFFNWRGDAEELIAALHAAGWKLMPRDPTEEMLKSGVAAWHKSPDEAGGNSTWLADAYRAMWDTVPPLCQRKMSEKARIIESTGVNPFCGDCGLMLLSRSIYFMTSTGLWYHTTCGPMQPREMNPQGPRDDAG